MNLPLSIRPCLAVYCRESELGREAFPVSSICIQRCSCSPAADIAGKAAPALALVGLLLLASCCAHADEDTRLRLEQGADYRAAQQERELLKDEGVGERPTLTIDGRTYTVGRNANDVGRALYISIQQRQWPAMLYFLDEYLTLEDRDPMLVAYAQGVLARLQGRLDDSESHYRELLDRQPDFLLGRLELARVLFENRKDRESAELFQQIATTLDPADARTHGVVRSVDTFGQALARRQAWQGSIALGPTWSDNLNQSSESVTCLWMYEGVCLFERSLPEAISAHGLEYELTLSKRVPLWNHHGLFFRALAYGQSYEEYGEYNQDTAIANLGYSYHDARNQYSLAPSFEFTRQGSDSLYGAWGLKGEWLHNLSAVTAFKLEAEHKKLRYRQEDYSRLDGASSTLFATAWRLLPGQWTLFGGFDLMDRSADGSEVESYRQGGIRLGLSKQFQAGFSATVFASFRHREYDAYSALFEARRRDDEQNYNLALRAPRLAVYGISPTLTLKHNRVRSNVDWLYSYDRNSVSLKLERQF